MSLNELASRHFQWVERMGWHNNNVLEALGLIASEVGEAAKEGLTGWPSQHLGEELADIVLRCLDLAHGQGTDLDSLMAGQTMQWHSFALPACLVEVLIEVAALINLTRHERSVTFSTNYGPAFGEGLARVIMRVSQIAAYYDIDLEDAVNQKMALNLKRGNRGRVV